jgi:hypothetical protein
MLIYIYAHVHTHTHTHPHTHTHTQAGSILFEGRVPASALDGQGAHSQTWTMIQHHINMPHATCHMLHELTIALTLETICQLMFLFNYMEMARVTGVPLGWLLVRGQMLKVMSQLLRKSQQKHLLIPALQSQPSDDTYEGATVIEPIKGFYSEPIATCRHSQKSAFPRKSAVKPYGRTDFLRTLGSGFCVSVSLYYDGTQSLLLHLNSQG